MICSCDWPACVRLQVLCAHSKINVSRHVGSVTAITSLHKLIIHKLDSSKVNNVLHAFVAPTVFS